MGKLLLKIVLYCIGGTVLLAGFFTLFGSHPIISFVDHKFDIMNNPLKEIYDTSATKKYEKVLISSENDSLYALSNGKNIAKEHLRHALFDSPMKDTVLYCAEDSLILYYTPWPIVCTISSIRLTIPLSTKHHKRHLPSSAKVIQ